ncbi:MAG: nucleotidyl transferase AbiEii/AbiGii toxin family protein [Tannerella sp.]|jgi:predicted nucleotidyltransferase component of viral defense system|nr:nucleotidyl transferase AbiEii/AbiGii toxin family protein [Tannerella sp.]
MILHTDSERFSTLITFTAEHFRISPAFIEKDYWITRSLQRMSQNSNSEKVVFKGGTSLSKAYRLTNRFSEDIDIAVIDAASFTGNQLKMLIKRLAKDMANELEEKVVEGVTSKGSRFYKAIYAYPNVAGLSASTLKAGQLLIEINTYANPYPYVKQKISCFITDYLETIDRQDLIETYQLSPFSINVLDKRRTVVEKLVSLIRFSFSENPTIALATKIRHFYDLYYLANEADCLAYIQSADFRKDLSELFLHDQQEFDVPKGWQVKTIEDSPLIKNFPALWESLRTTYQKELITLAFSEIPGEKQVAQKFMDTISGLQ